MPEPKDHYEYLIKPSCKELESNIKQKTADFSLRGILEDIWQIVYAANKAIDDRKPWKLAKEPDQKELLASFIYELLEAIRIIGVYLVPFMPKTSVKIGSMFAEEREVTYKNSGQFGKLQPGTLLKKGEPLFPKKED